MAGKAAKLLISKRGGLMTLTAWRTANKKLHNIWGRETRNLEIGMAQLQAAVQDALLERTWRTASWTWRSSVSLQWGQNASLIEPTRVQLEDQQDYSTCRSMAAILHPDLVPPARARHWQIGHGLMEGNQDEQNVGEPDLKNDQRNWVCSA